MKAYTDYPIVELGDEPCTRVAVREVWVVSNWERYCEVRVEGVEEPVIIKRWYLYRKPGRWEEGAYLSFWCRLYLQVREDGIWHGVQFCYREWSHDVKTFIWHLRTWRSMKTWFKDRGEY